ncbi:hypothetical protein FP2506_08826 [Fulvimarina pelagi HTCC2506]|uniref:Uncharacterized protein n=1 Tax=Fulvimarina pelagi HTCC2506 TaxID=314231 RepID=Q0G5Y1_9HYPH|nr:hypothetical protein FP2506_08826 [Fulvimarina pelagi HTCC2506]
MGERVVRNDEVSGSIPLSSTSFSVPSNIKRSPLTLYPVEMIHGR